MKAELGNTPADKNYKPSGIPIKIYHGEYEYIRKDVLLKSLKEYKENPVISDLQKGNIQELMDEIKKL